MKLMNQVCSALLSASMVLAPTASVMANETSVQEEIVESTTTEEETASEYEAAYTGLVNYGGNVWRYQVKGTVQWNYTGLVQYYGTWYYVENGTLNWNYTGLTNYYGTWYYVENGVLNWGYTGLTNYYGTWYYVENGVLNWGYTGLTNYYGTWYYVENGVLNWDYSGLTNYYGTWYYIGKGVLTWKATGLVEYYGTWYYVENSVLNWNYTGYYVDGFGKKYYIENGVMQKEKAFKLQDISAETDKFAITPMLIYYNQKVNREIFPEYSEVLGWDGAATSWKYSCGGGMSNVCMMDVDLVTGVGIMWWYKIGYREPAKESTVDFINKTATGGYSFFVAPDKQIKTLGFLWEEFGITNQQQLIDMMKTGKGKNSIASAVSKYGTLGSVDYLGTTGKGRLAFGLTNTLGGEMGYVVVDPVYNYFVVYSMRCKFLVESRIGS